MIACENCKHSITKGNFLYCSKLDSPIHSNTPCGKWLGSKTITNNLETKNYRHTSNDKKTLCEKCKFSFEKGFFSFCSILDSPTPLGNKPCRKWEEKKPNNYQTQASVYSKDTTDKSVSELPLAESLDKVDFVDSGYVYILINRAIPNLIKIGKTTRMPETRAVELSSPTGIPVPYQVYFAVFVNQCSKIELQAHRLLKDYRENSGREFFRLSPEKAKLVLQKLSVGFDL
jgi:hypothetical protein